MSTDPHAGIAYVTLLDSATSGVQFSAVEVAPDEFLTAAHAVTRSDGSFRTSGTVVVGYTGAPGSGVSLAVDGVHALDNQHGTGTETDSSVGTDLALIHVSTPDAGGTVFNMAPGTAGAGFTASGYPANGGGALSEASETTTSGVAGELLGTALLVGGDAHGSSGGPLWSLQNGAPTVAGVVAAGSGQSCAFAALTPADIATIDGWIYSDDAGQPWASAHAPAGSAPAATPVPVAAAPAAAPAPDRLEQIAVLAEADATGASGMRLSVLNDVGGAFAGALAQGCSGSDMADAADVMASILRQGSATPVRAIGFMAGMVASEMGSAGGAGRLAAFAANTLGLNLGNQVARQAAVNGYHEDQAFGLSPAAAPFGASAAELAAAIAGGGGAGSVSAGVLDAAAASAARLSAPHLLHAGH